MNRRQFLQKGLASLVLGSSIGGCLSHQQEFEIEMLGLARKIKYPICWACEDHIKLYVSDPDGLEKVEVYDEDDNMIHSFEFPKSIFPTKEKILKLYDKTLPTKVKIYDSYGNVTKINPPHIGHA